MAACFACRLLQGMLSPPPPPPPHTHTFLFTPKTLPRGTDALEQSENNSKGVFNTESLFRKTVQSSVYINCVSIRISVPRRVEEWRGGGGRMGGGGWRGRMRERGGSISQPLSLFLVTFANFPVSRFNVSSYPLPFSPSIFLPPSRLPCPPPPPPATYTPPPTLHLQHTHTHTVNLSCPVHNKHRVSYCDAFLRRLLRRDDHLIRPKVPLTVSAAPAGTVQSERAADHVESAKGKATDVG